jgi:hypothetical protein
MPPRDKCNQTDLWCPMTRINFLERLARHLPWVREHERIMQASRRAIVESESDRRDITSKLDTIRPESKQRKVS